MSYILDALKKADAEREREGVPGLHAQHVAQHAEHDASSHGSVGMRWAAGGLAIGLVLLAAWWLMFTPEPAPAPAPYAAGPAMQPVAPVAQAALQPPIPPTPTMATVEPTAPSNLPYTAPPTAPNTEAGRVNQASMGQPAGKRNGSGNGTNGSTNESTNSAARAAAPQGPDTDRVVAVAELPEDVRRELPALSIGGAMHSDVPANRMLVLNGGIFHEGDQPSPGLVLVEIKLKSAIFRFKGHSYSVAF